jgi:hypothetical protein
MGGMPWSAFNLAPHLACYCWIFQRETPTACTSCGGFAAYARISQWWRFAKAKMLAGQMKPPGWARKRFCFGRSGLNS